MKQHRANLLSIYHAALKAVHGRRCVAEWLQQHPQGDSCHVVAIGKAAAAMSAGALDVLAGQIERMLVITRHGYGDAVLSQDGRVHQLESGHPVPDQASLDAGQAMLDFIASTPSSSPLLFLISGGTSALVEVLPDGVTLSDLQRVNDWLLGSGLPIQQMNAVRCALSSIKGGRLATYLQGRPTQVLLISDVAEDDPAIIGSGLLFANDGSGLEGIQGLPAWLVGLLAGVKSAAPESLSLQGPIIPHHIIASADSARQAAVSQAQQLGYYVVEHRQRITGDIYVVANQLAGTLAAGELVLHVWSGETTVILPENPGNGGRCQSLALAFVLQQQRRNLHEWLFLAAGSDGSDGSGETAGALVDGQTCSRLLAAGVDAQQCLARADAGSCLQLSQDLIVTGPSGTNVMDIMMALSLN